LTAEEKRRQAHGSAKKKQSGVKPQQSRIKEKRRHAPLLLSYSDLFYLR
jgi:hypothetical protein